MRRTGVVRTVRREDPNARYCPAGHYLSRTLLVWRQRLIREETGIQQPTITCDGCQSPIIDQHIAGSCKTCDIDFCEGCFQSGRSIEDMLQPPAPSTTIQRCCMMVIVDSPDPLTAAARGERYNGRRPSYQHCGRVSYDAYPDPTSFGWTFTGSCEGGRAEFFEKDFAEHGVVKLDFYYTTGTVKTVLDHPRQGVTQLFAKGSNLSPELYRQILRDPRAHTNVRYHRR
jgi:hypothetical protein